MRRAEAPLYARLLRLRNVAPSGLTCFFFLEGSVALAALLALAELVSWWGVVVLPVLVALMVKLNDMVAGAVRPAPREVARAEPQQEDDATTRLPGVVRRKRGAPIMRPWAEEAEAQQRWTRQTAARRYE
jgi:hypothetical protein